MLAYKVARAQEAQTWPPMGTVALIFFSTALYALLLC